MTSPQVICANKLRSGRLLTSLYRARVTGCGCFPATAFSNIGYAPKWKYDIPIKTNRKLKSPSSSSILKILKYDLSRDFRCKYSRSLHKLGLIEEYKSKSTGVFSFRIGEPFYFNDKERFLDRPVKEQIEGMCDKVKRFLKSKLGKHSRYLLSLLNQIQGNKMMFSLSGKQTSNQSEQPDQQNQDQHEHNPGDDQNQLPWQQLIPLLILGAFYLLTPGGESVPETSYPVFYREMLSTGEVASIAVASTRDIAYVYLHHGAVVNGKEHFGPGPHYTFTISSVENLEEKLNKAQEELGISSSDFIPVKYRQQNQFMTTVVDAMITIFILGLVLYILRASTRGRGGSSFGGNPFGSFTKARTTIIDPTMRKGISFKDVAGMEEAKQEIMEFVEYLQNPSRFTDLGAKIPKGALLIGPPGTGKTLLAKAIATEAHVPFLTMAGSDFVEMFAGVGSARVRDLFAQARKRAPCIVYIDEVDAIGRSRRSLKSSGGNSEEENTLNQLLVEMDGINTVEGVVMLASTNRADILDQALLRPGRFDRMINIDLPTLIERQQIFEIYLTKLKLEKPLSHYSKRLAELTPGKSGADIANVCNEAALHAARLNDKVIQQNNFEYAVERVVAGMEKKSQTLSPAERRVVAYHEAGHAVLGWMLKYTEPILKISIVPRTNSVLGYTLKMPLDKFLHTKEQLFDTMCMTLGGRVAEEMIFNRITTGAEDDLRKVTESAYQQIVTFGMNDRIGPISFQLKKRTDIARKPYSDKMAKMIDEEVSRLVKKAYEETKNQLNINKDKLEKLAEALLEKEVLNYDDLVKLLGQAPYGDKRQLLNDKLAVDESPPLNT